MINKSSRNLFFLLAFVHSAASFSVIPSSGRGKASDINILIADTSDLQQDHNSHGRGDVMILRLSKRSDEEILAAEKAVVDEAMHVSDAGMEAAVMERAVMLAHEIMKKKKKELKKKVEDARAAEQQYAMMEHATEDLVRQYRENPTKFKHSYSSETGSRQVEIEVLESVILEAARKMKDIVSSQKLVISQFYDLLESEHQAEARAAKEGIHEKVIADHRVVFIEEFDDPEKQNLIEQEEMFARHLIEQKRNEKVLLADLKEIQDIVQNWKSSIDKEIV